MHGKRAGGLLRDAEEGVGNSVRRRGAVSEEEVVMLDAVFGECAGIVFLQVCVTECVLYSS